MGCIASKLEEEEVVAAFRERKHQLKLAVDRKYALAEAHYRYCQSLFGVSAAISLFVARHSSPLAPFSITFPSPSSPTRPKENVVSNPLFLQQTPSEPTKATIAHESCSSSTSSESSDEEYEKKIERERGRSHRISEEDLRIVREQEGIPELEEEGGGGERMEGETRILERKKSTMSLRLRP
ncbi:unnamed protein product [Fraxinus pennsylvanica]|uniref:DUF630 domain-containing protein n=1 Tax=Fraxinus pennsylvanica TaxID=56036 RepID=A0AAD1ZMN9_9LAMI|nr:unnamed protein product [Fraxinus pennsylvanica]